MNIINTQIINKNFYQNTIKSSIFFNGVGIHSGKAVNMTLHPADDVFGIVFKRVDLDIENYIKVIPENIDFSKYCSKLKNKHGVLCFNNIIYIYGLNYFIFQI